MEHMEGKERGDVFDTEIREGSGSDISLIYCSSYERDVCYVLLLPSDGWLRFELGGIQDHK